MMRHKTWDDCTAAQKLERWENVLRVLRGLSPHQRREHFDMGHWLEKTECGTVGCAGGFCALDPWFRRRGFTGKFLVATFFQFTTMIPPAFFGQEGSERIFCNPRFTSRKGVGVYVQVVAAVKDYIKVLKKAAKEWADAPL